MVPSISKRIPPQMWVSGLPVKAGLSSSKGILRDSECWADEVVPKVRK